MGQFISSVGKSNLAAGAFTLLFTCCASIVLMNMLTGIIVEVMHIVGAMEKEELMVNYVKKTMNEVLRSTDIDQDGNEMLSVHEFQALLLTPGTARVIRDLGVDPVGLVDFADFLYRDRDEISFPEVIQLLVQLRGANQCTVKDIVDLRKFVAQELRYMEKHFQKHLG